MIEENGNLVDDDDALLYYGNEKKRFLLLQADEIWLDHNSFQMIEDADLNSNNSTASNMQDVVQGAFHIKGKSQVIDFHYFQLFI